MVAETSNRIAIARSIHERRALKLATWGIDVRPAAMSIVVFAGVFSSTFAQERPPTPVKVCGVVEREAPATIRLVGSIGPDRRAVAASEVSGLLAAFDRQQGDFVRSGDEICRIDSFMSGLRLQEAQAKLGSLRQRVSELEHGTRPEELRRWRAAVAEAQALLDKWEFEKKRVDELVRQNVGTPTEHHNTTMEFLAAQLRLEQARAILETAENGPRAEVLAQSRFEVAGQEAIVSRWQREWEKTVIRAPFDGFITAKRTEVGEWIEVGGPVCELVSVETIRIRIDVPESAISFAVAGSDAWAEIEAVHRKISTTVSRVIPQANPSARTFPVELDVKNEDHRLLPGMFAWVRVASGPKAKRLMVHQDAISGQGAARQVFVIRSGPAGMTAVPLPVELGLEVGEEVEILAPGIAAGDSVVCRANERLFGPTLVTPTPLDDDVDADSTHSSNGR